MSLWIELAHQTLIGTDLAAIPEGIGNRVIRTFQTEELFWVLLVSALSPGETALRVAARAEQMLTQGRHLEALTTELIAGLPRGEHLPISLLVVPKGPPAELVEIDAPPLFLARGGRPALLPVIEEEVHGRLVRRCTFRLEEGDYLAIVGEELIRTRGWERRWGWPDIALSIKRLTDTGGDAEQLLGALVRMYARLARGERTLGGAVVAMHVRPLRRATVWSGPPADERADVRAVEQLMAAVGTRAICGDTTAAVAARVLGRRLEMEPRPAEGWAEVPPVSRLEGVDLVTEGVVTLRRTRERLAAAERAADLPRSNDGATRLARLLLEADVIHFLVGRAVNPAQRDGVVPWRQEVVEGLVAELRAHGRIVGVEEVG